METSEKIIKVLEDMSCDDETIDVLENAMEFYCGTHDKCMGFKQAVMLCLQDQVENHYDEEVESDLKKLLEMLTK